MQEFNNVLAIILILLMLISSFIKSSDRFLINIFNVMNGIGAIYYVMGGSLYKRPSDTAIFYIILIYIALNISYILYSSIFKKIGISKISNIDILVKRKKILYILLIFFLFPIYYFILYYKAFPITLMILGDAVGESFRPDVSGALPHYYTFSVFLSALTFPFLIQLFIVEYAKYKNFLIALLILFFSLLIGDKSTLLSMIFYLYLIKGKTNIKKIIVFSIIFIGFYMLMKFLYYQELRYEDTYALFESIFRRVCLIGPSAFGTYIDDLVLSNNIIPESFTHIKQYLFYLIYGYKEGGLSVIFPASYLDIIGIGFIQIILTGVLFLLILIVRNLILKLRLIYTHEIILYLHFYGAILIAQGFLSDIFVRWVFPVFFFIALNKIFISRNKKIRNNKR